MNEIMKNIVSRRSVRKFTDEPVSEEDVLKLLHAGMSGPSACNRTPWEFFVVTNPEVLEKAMRIYNGKPLINSVNGKADSMASIFPLVKKYGGVVVGLTLDENGKAALICAKDGKQLKSIPAKLKKDETVLVYDLGVEYDYLIVECMPDYPSGDIRLMAMQKTNDIKKAMTSLKSTGLKGLGLEEIETVGKPFDPEFHEAVSRVQDPTKEDQVIVEEFRKGYKIGNKVVRHSMVIVNSN